MKKSGLALVCVLGILLLAGCGTTTSTTTTSMTTSTVATTPGQPPIQVISVTGPVPPINPGGPTVEIVLKNVADQPVISLTAVLGINGAPPGHPFTFNFNVASPYPLPPGETATRRMTLIGGGFGSDIDYPLTISGTLQDGTVFGFTVPVQISPPPG